MPVVSAPQPGLPSDPTPPGQVRFERLLSLSVHHDFYGKDFYGKAAVCGDFIVAPTAATEILLQYLGLVAKPTRGGVDIFYYSNRAAAMLRALWHRRQDHHDRASSDFDRPRLRASSWSRLTFTFALDNPLFANFTAMPLAVRPGRDCLYLSNRAVSADGGAVRLALDWKDAIATQEVTFSAAHVHIPTPKDAKQVAIYDTSGRAILVADKTYVPPAPHPLDAGTVAHQHHHRPPRKIPMTPGTDLHLDMTREPAGLYSYVVITDKPGPETRFIYAGINDAPLLMVDLFFDRTEQPGHGGDFFPVELPNNLPDDATAWQYITPRRYEIRFAARETLWTYYIVVPQGGPTPDTLSIEADSPRAPAFVDPPSEVTLPTGAAACRFTAQAAAALQSRPDAVLRLRGGDGVGSKRILLDRLPLPSAETILPPLPPRRPDDPATSEVFVYL